MNLSPTWITAFANAGFSAVHWSQIGAVNATDRELMQWARDHAHIVFTHDLDFSAILGLTNASGPSVIQIRGDRVLPDDIAARLILVMRDYEKELDQGAIIVIDEARSRLRLLPLNPSANE